MLLHWQHAPIALAAVLVLILIAVLVAVLVAVLILVLVAVLIVVLVLLIHSRFLHDIYIRQGRKASLPENLGSILRFEK